MTKTVNPNWVQGHYRFENDDGTLDGSTFIDAQDTTITQAADSNFRLRINWGEADNQSTATNLTPELEFNINGGTWTTVGATTAVQYTSSGNETDNNTGSERLTTAPTGSASYTQTYFDDNNTLASQAPADAYYELSFNLTIDSAQVSNNDTINFQLVDGAATEVFTSRDTNPSLTVTLGATNYDRTLSASVDANDQQTRAAQALRNLLSSLETNDLLTRLILREYVRNLTANISVTDGDAERLLTANYTVTETTTITDLIIRTLETSSQTYERFLSANIEVNDAIVRSLFRLYSRTLSDGLDVNDSITRLVAVVYERVLSDALDANDTLSRWADLNRTLSENLEVADSLILTVIGGDLFERTLSTSLDVVDSLDRETDLFRLLNSNIAINDLIVVLNLFNRLLTDTSDVFDSLTREVAVGVTVRILSDALSVTDGDIERLLDANYTVNESLTIEDLVTRTVETIGLINRTLSASLSVNDSVSRILDLVRVLQTSADANDGIIRTLELFNIINRTLLAAVDINDTIGRTITTSAIVRTLLASIGVQDLTTDQRITNAVLTTNANITDSTINEALLIRLLQDATDIDDSIIRTITIYTVETVRTLVASIEINDSLSTEFLLHHLVSASVDVTDNLVMTYDYFVTVVERFLSANIDLQDALSRDVFRVVGRSLGSAIILTDQIFRSSELMRVVADNLTVEDLINIFTPFVERILQDNIELSDTVIQTILRSSKAVDIIMRLVKRDIDLETALEAIIVDLEKVADSEVKKI